MARDVDPAAGSTRPACVRDADASGRSSLETQATPVCETSGSERQRSEFDIAWRALRLCSFEQRPIVVAQEVVQLQQIDVFRPEVARERARPHPVAGRRVLIAKLHETPQHLASSFFGRWMLDDLIAIHGVHSLIGHNFSARNLLNTAS